MDSRRYGEQIWYQWNFRWTIQKQQTNERNFNFMNRSTFFIEIMILFVCGIFQVNFIHFNIAACYQIIQKFIKYDNVEKFIFFMARHHQDQPNHWMSGTVQVWRMVGFSLYHPYYRTDTHVFVNFPAILTFFLEDSHSVSFAMDQWNGAEWKLRKLRKVCTYVCIKMFK